MTHLSYASHLNTYTGFPPYLVNLEFCHFPFQAWKMPGICSKVVKTWNVNSKPWKNLQFANSMFQVSFFKMSFTKIILIYIFVISTLSTQTLIRSQPWISLLLPRNNLDNKLILCHKRRGNPASVLTYFEIFYIKLKFVWKYLEFGIKNLEFRTKNLENTWNLVFGKKVGTLIQLWLVLIGKLLLVNICCFPINHFFDELSTRMSSISSWGPFRKHYWREGKLLGGAQISPFVGGGGAFCEILIIQKTKRA